MLLALSDVTYVLIGWFKFLLLMFLYEYRPCYLRIYKKMCSIVFRAKTIIIVFKMKVLLEYFKETVMNVAWYMSSSELETWGSESVRDFTSRP